VAVAGRTCGRQGIGRRCLADGLRPLQQQPQGGLATGLVGDGMVPLGQVLPVSAPAERRAQRQRAGGGLRRRAQREQPWHERGDVFRAAPLQQAAGDIGPGRSDLAARHHPIGHAQAHLQAAFRAHL
jgi:hypothetical protein